MPRTKAPSKAPTKRPFNDTPVPLTQELQKRFDELDVPSDVIDLDCTICGQGRGVPKLVHRDIRLCVVCWTMLSKAKPEKRSLVIHRAVAGKLDVETWQTLRLPFFRDWMASEHRMQAVNQIERSKQCSTAS